MLRLLSITLLAGCELVFALDDPGPTPPPPGEEVCGGNDPLALFDGCRNALHPEISRPATIRTGDIADPTDPGDCDEILVQTDLDATELCLIVADDVELANTVVVGPRPLVLMAADELVISGPVLVTSRGAQQAAGGDFASCTSLAGGQSPVGAGAGDGGGGGGSFGTQGGDGGNGSVALSGGPGGAAGVVTLPLTFIRGGCRGGAGGRNTVTGAGGGAGGRSGGAIYLVAGDRITLEGTGTIDVSGEGGAGGAPGAMTGGGGGGGGGGSGGLIAFDAPQIVLAPFSRLIANGGGGGGGGSGENIAGARGASANSGDAFPFPAAGGGGTQAGDGGDGTDAVIAVGSVAGHSVGDNFGGGGGGGGGGLGLILLFGEVQDQGASTSPQLP